MKRYLTLLLGLAALGSARASIIFQAEPPTAPEKLPLVRIAPVRLSQDTLLRRAADFNFKPGRPVKTPRGIVTRNGSLMLAQDALGTELFADTDRYMAETPGEAPPLSDAEVVKLGDAQLRMHPGGVNVAEIALERVRHLMNAGQDLKSGEQMPPTQDETILIYRRQFNGVPVIPMDGSGEHLRMHFDNKGNLVAQHRLWRNARMLPEALPLLPYATVRDQFVRQLTQEMGTSGQDALIKRIEFGYFGRPEGQTQGFFQPAYLFTVELYSPEEKQTTGARLIPVSALDPKLMPEPLELPSPPSEQGSRDQIKFAVSPPNTPGSMATYPILPTPLSSESILLRAQQLGITGGTLDKTPRGLMVSDGRLLLAQDPAGSELFSDTKRMMNETPGEAPPMSDAEVLRFAAEWLKGQGIPGDQVGTPVVRRLMHQAFDIKGQRETTPTPDEAIVEFPRLVPRGTLPPDPCIGPGAFLNVHFDNKGVVTGHHWMWRQLGQPLKAVDPRPYSVLQDEFLRQLESEIGRSQAVVTGIQYGLYFRPEGVAQNFAQPAVLFDVDILDPDTGEITAHRQIPIPAGDSLMEPLDNPEDQLVPDDPNNETTREADAIPLAYGDVTGDGSVDVQDVMGVLVAFSGLGGGDLLPSAVNAGDVFPAGFPGGNGQLDMGDALRILRSIYQLDDVSGGA